MIYLLEKKKKKTHENGKKKYGEEDKIKRVEDP